MQLGPLEFEAGRLVVAAATGARDAASVCRDVENALEAACMALRVPWTPFVLEPSGGRAGARFAAVAHGAVVIVYAPPRRFSGQATSLHAHAEASARSIQREEGRALGEYVLVAWDGAQINFGRFQAGEGAWEPLLPFDTNAAARLLQHLHDDGMPLVHPALLSALVGPDSRVGRALVPQLFDALLDALLEPGRHGAARPLYDEWGRLFGQVAGIQGERLQGVLRALGAAHGRPYEAHPVAYLFALNTYIALVAKLVAALSLRNGAGALGNPAVPLHDRIERMESGRLFADAGVVNMLVGDFFSWYAEEPTWSRVAPAVDDLLARLAGVSFDVRRKDPDATRDLFKGMYMTFVPRALRHALGEFYTPDWMAAHALDALGWSPTDDLLDPTCGSGTFLLEAVRRRLTAGGGSARHLLHGLAGMDLNPLAVLSARASLVTFLSPYLDPNDPVHVPVYLADAINSAHVDGEMYVHVLQTDAGTTTFRVPRSVVTAPTLYPLFLRLRALVDGGTSADTVWRSLAAEFPDLPDAVRAIVDTVVVLHIRGWNSIWCAILADRFTAGALAPVSFVAGNPPWVKWSNLPPAYAAFIKPRCVALGVFSQDRWVGGIESDISTVITYAVVDKWLRDQGKLGFYITGTVFANESSQGFRRFALADRGVSCRVLGVEDFGALAPFDGVSTPAALLLLQRGATTTYPVPYRTWSAPRVNGAPVRGFASAAAFRAEAVACDLLAAPVPGTDAGPWLRGTPVDHAAWAHIFGNVAPAYKARKGVTTDLNGLFFVEVLAAADGTCSVRNDPALGRKPGLAQVTATIEDQHVFPLLRGRGVAAFSATPDRTSRVLAPQRGMHGDPNLPTTAPRTHQFLARFEALLAARSSLRRFQKGQPYWSLWSTGAYTFSPYKVVWKEMSSGRFVAAYVGDHDDPLLGRRTVVPDHKLYFVPVDTEDEAAYVTGLLNAPTVAHAISAYASQLSLGVSVVEYLEIPRWAPEDGVHRAVATIARGITGRIAAGGAGPTAGEASALDVYAAGVFGFAAG
ncbi:MAG: hypothetical protein V4850_35330 [Myxococcota bacterium]